MELAIGERSAGGQQRGNVDRAQGVRVERFVVDIDGAPLLSMSARAGGILRLDRLDHGHPIFREILQGILMLGTTTQEIRESDFATVGKQIDELVPNIVAKIHGLFPRVEEEGKNRESEQGTRNVFVSISRGHRQEDISLAVRVFLPGVLRDLVGGLGSAIEDEICRLSYLGPLRSYPPRHLAFSQHHDPNWYAGGGHAWDVVRRNSDIRHRVNLWLGNTERLQTPYKLMVRELLPSSLVAAELPSRLNEKFHDVLVSMLADLTVGKLSADRPEIARIDEAVHSEYIELSDLGPFPEIQELVASMIDTDQLTRSWVREMVESRLDSLQDLVLVDQRTNTTVSHRDVGIGVSQVLPILVSAYASKNDLLAIEQPEIHLHPALQAELGDVFIESALGSGGNTFLIETHSEHLLLRIMRRMRETSTGELPDGVTAVRAEDVMVLFVEADGPQSIVREMPLNERGELVKAWPGGFFEEGLREIF